MPEHSENEIYAVTCRLEQNVLKDQGIVPHVMSGYLQAISDVQKLFCESVFKIPIDYQQHLINLMED